MLALSVVEAGEEKIFNHMKQKGFPNITVEIVGVIVLASVVGYFIVNQRTPAPTQPSITDINQTSTTPDTTEYPYTLKPLSQTQLSSLRSEFEASNKNVCAQINEYGFTEDKSGCFGEIIIVEITDETSVVEMAKNWLVQNSKFTGISRKSDAVVERIITTSGKKVTLIIHFRAQTYNNLPIEGDIKPITVFANVNSVSRIYGYWFPKITVPLEPKISESFARNKLNGRIFTYSEFAGDPINYRVEQKDLSKVAHKVVFVKKSFQGLEFRLAWKILVGQGLLWTVYVDAITGKELKVVQMFNT